MGVRKLWEILEPTKEVLPLEHLANKRLCIDLSYWIIQLSKVNGGRVKDKPHLRGLFHRLRALVALNCQLVFVADGAVPIVKSVVYNHRLACIGNTSKSHNSDKPEKALRPIRRNKGSEFGRMIEEAKEMGDAFGIPCLTSLEEAEAQCAVLNAEGFCDGCVTADSDAFLFGARVVYKEISLGKSGSGGYVVAYQLSTIQRELGYGRFCLVALAFLLGSDYFPGINGIGPEKAQQIIRNNGEKRIMELLACQGPLRLARHLLMDYKTSKKVHNMRGIQCFEKENINPKAVFDDGVGMMMGDDQVVSEAILAYCNPKTFSSDTSIVQKMLSGGLVKLEKLRTICMEAFEWPFNRTDEYVLPKIAENNLRIMAEGKAASMASTIQAVPLKYTISHIVKLRSVHGVEHYEVKWLGNPEFHSSVVPADIVKRAYAEKVSEFVAARCDIKKKQARCKIRSQGSENSFKSYGMTCENSNVEKLVIQLQKSSLNLVSTSNQAFEQIQDQQNEGLCQLSRFYSELSTDHSSRKHSINSLDEMPKFGPKVAQNLSSTAFHDSLSQNKFTKEEDRLSTVPVDAACTACDLLKNKTSIPPSLKPAIENQSMCEGGTCKKTPKTFAAAEIVDLTTPTPRKTLVEEVEGSMQQQQLQAGNAAGALMGTLGQSLSILEKCLSCDPFPDENEDDDDDREHRERAFQLREFLANMKK